MLSPSNMRERSFYDGRDTVNSYAGSGVAAGNNGSYVLHSWNQYSRIVDRINPKGHGGFRSPGPCYHLSLGATPESGYTSGYASGSNWDFGYDYSKMTILHGAALPAEVEASLPTLPETKLLSQRLAAWKKFHTVIPETVSVANFTYELKDFEDVAKGIQKIPKLKSVPKTKFSKLPAVANSTFLAWNFAWAPFIGDLIKMRGLIDSLPKRLDFLRRNRGKPVRVHFRGDNIWSDPGPVDEAVNQYYWTRYPGSIYLDSQFVNYLRLRSYTANFAASCTIVQDVEGLDDAWTGLKACYAALGLNNPMKIVWNAIPFSFMLDWIAPVGDMLGLVAANPFPGRWDVFDVSNSLTENMYFDESVWAYPGNPGSTGPKVCRVVQAKRYQRWLNLHLTSDDVQFSSLTNHQQRLFASLAAGNTLFKG